MDSSSQLEDFIACSRAAGEEDSEGQFTVASAKALEKLANFQLPFEGAWALKLVQAAVATGEVEKITISLERNANRFRLVGLTDWRIEEVESALLGVSFEGRRDLEHLATALRLVGFGEGRMFFLTHYDWPSALVWNGKTLERVKAKAMKGRGAFIQVSVRALGETDNLLGLTTTRRNATIHRVLASRAHTCPVPLTLDGRRLDGLEFDPNHGMEANWRVPFWVSFRGNNLPPLTLRVGDQSPLFEFDQSEEQFREAVPGHRTASVVYIVTGHLLPDGLGWKQGESHSLLNWVADGVVMESEVISNYRSLCSTGCFVCADELGVDLSAFAIREDEKARLRSTIIRTLSTELDKDTDRLWAATNVVKPPPLKSVTRALAGTMLFTLGAVKMAVWPLAAVAGAMTFRLSTLTMHDSDTWRELEGQLKKSVREINSNLIPE